MNLRKDHKRKTRNVLRVHGLSRSRNDSKLQNKNPPLEKKSCGVRQPAGLDVYCVCGRPYSFRGAARLECPRFLQYKKEEKTRGAKVFAPLLLFLYIPIEGGKNEGRESVCASLTIPLYSEGKNQTRFVWVSGALMRGGLKRIRPIEIDFFPASA